MVKPDIAPPTVEPVQTKITPDQPLEPADHIEATASGSTMPPPRVAPQGFAMTPDVASKTLGAGNRGYAHPASGTVSNVDEHGFIVATTNPEHRGQHIDEIGGYYPRVNVGGRQQIQRPEQQPIHHSMKPEPEPTPESSPQEPGAWSQAVEGFKQAYRDAKAPPVPVTGELQQAEPAPSMPDEPENVVEGAGEASEAAEAEADAIAPEVQGETRSDGLYYPKFAGSYAEQRQGLQAINEAINHAARYGNRRRASELLTELTQRQIALDNFGKHPSEWKPSQRPREGTKPFDPARWRSETERVENEHRAALDDWEQSLRDEAHWSSDTALNALGASAATPEQLQELGMHLGLPMHLYTQITTPAMLSDLINAYSAELMEDPNLQPEGGTPLHRLSEAVQNITSIPIHEHKPHSYALPNTPPGDPDFQSITNYSSFAEAVDQYDTQGKGSFITVDPDGDGKGQAVYVTPGGKVNPKAKGGGGEWKNFRPQKTEQTDKAAPPTGESDDHNSNPYEEGLRRIERLASAYDRSATGPGVGRAVGAGGIDERQRVDLLRHFVKLVRSGQNVDQAADAAKELGRKWVREHNQRRPKDVNWQRWENTHDRQIESAVRMLRPPQQFSSFGEAVEHYATVKTAETKTAKPKTPGAASGTAAGTRAKPKAPETTPSTPRNYSPAEAQRRLDADEAKAAGPLYRQPESEGSQKQRQQRAEMRGRVQADIDDARTTASVNRRYQDLDDAIGATQPPTTRLTPAQDQSINTRVEALYPEIEEPVPTYRQQLGIDPMQPPPQQVIDPSQIQTMIGEPSEQATAPEAPARTGQVVADNVPKGQMMRYKNKPFLEQQPGDINRLVQNDDGSLRVEVVSRGDRTDDEWGPERQRILDQNQRIRNALRGDPRAIVPPENIPVPNVITQETTGLPGVPDTGEEAGEDAVESPSDMQLVDATPSSLNRPRTLNMLPTGRRRRAPLTDRPGEYSGGRPTGNVPLARELRQPLTRGWRRRAPSMAAQAQLAANQGANPPRQGSLFFRPRSAEQNSIVNSAPLPDQEDAPTFEERLKAFWDSQFTRYAADEAPELTARTFTDEEKRELEELADELERIESAGEDDDIEFEPDADEEVDTETDGDDFDEDDDDDEWWEEDDEDDDDLEDDEDDSFADAVAKYDATAGDWKTIKGTHVLMDDGKIVAGPKRLRDRDKSPGELKEPSAKQYRHNPAATSGRKHARRGTKRDDIATHAKSDWDVADDRTKKRYADADEYAQAMLDSFDQETKHREDIRTGKKERKSRTKYEPKRGYGEQKIRHSKKFREGLKQLGVEPTKDNLDQYREVADRLLDPINQPVYEVLDALRNTFGNAQKISGALRSARVGEDEEFIKGLDEIAQGIEMDETRAGILPTDPGDLFRFLKSMDGVSPKPKKNFDPEVLAAAHEEIQAASDEEPEEFDDDDDDVSFDFGFGDDDDDLDEFAAVSFADAVSRQLDLAAAN